MKIIVDRSLYSPADNFDFYACDDDISPDGPVGYGRTPKAALQELLELVDGDPDTEAAVVAKLIEVSTP